MAKQTLMQYRTIDHDVIKNILKKNKNKLLVQFLEMLKGKIW